MIAKKFENLIFWQKARELTKLVYSYSKNGGFQKDFELKDQVRRAAVSTMSNIAEGFGRGGNKEFIQFLFVAKGSLTETQSHLYVALDQEYIDDNKFSVAYDKAEEVIRLINSFIMSIEKTDKRGFSSSKFPKKSVQSSKFTVQSGNKYS
jgi:four helix bundle protein